MKRLHEYISPIITAILVSVLTGSGTVYVSLGVAREDIAWLKDASAQHDGEIRALQIQTAGCGCKKAVASAPTITLHPAPGVSFQALTAGVVDLSPYAPGTRVKGR